MKRVISLAWSSFVAARRARATARALERLDERTLRDIGLEREANRVRERNRFARLRVHVIAMGNTGIDLEYLSELAKQNDGEFLHLTGTH